MFVDLPLCSLKFFKITAIPLILENIKTKLLANALQGKCNSTSPNTCTNSYLLEKCTVLGRYGPFKTL